MIRCICISSQLIEYSTALHLLNTVEKDACFSIFFCYLSRNASQNFNIKYLLLIQLTLHFTFQRFENELTPKLREICMLNIVCKILEIH